MSAEYFFMYIARRALAHKNRIQCPKYFESASGLGSYRHGGRGDLPRPWFGPRITPLMKTVSILAALVENFTCPSTALSGLNRQSPSSRDAGYFAVEPWASGKETNG